MSRRINAMSGDIEILVIVKLILALLVFDLQVDELTDLTSISQVLIS